MKKIALIALLVVATVGVPVASAIAAPAVGKVTVSVSPRYPTQNSSVTTVAKVTSSTGKAIAGAKVVFRWYYKSSTVSATRYTNANGKATLVRSIGKPTVGYRVNVKATASSGGVTRSSYGWFRPCYYIAPAKIKSWTPSGNASSGLTRAYISYDVVSGEGNYTYVTRPFYLSNSTATAYYWSGAVSQPTARVSRDTFFRNTQQAAYATCAFKWYWRTNASGVRYRFVPWIQSATWAN